jgi:ribosome biogenesis GTPase
MKLESLGWNDFFEAYFAPHRGKGYLPGRVSIHHRERYVIYTEQGELWGQVSGKFRFDAAGLKDYPSAGDWVAFSKTGEDQPAIIHKVLERKSKFSRKTAGNRSDEQIIAANIDIVFLVMGLDGDYNPRRLERYLAFAWDSGAHPVVVLNKSDICPALQECIDETRSVARDADVIVMSAFHPEDIRPIRSLMKPGLTGVLLGSSGVGKSTITNILLGKEHSRVQEVRESDSRGRHTTSYRELLVLPEGGIIIDTPGLRELQFLESEENLPGGFDDIEELASNCRFRDCNHDSEPGCAVKNAIEEGRLEAKRFENYRKFQREIGYQTARQGMGAQKLEKERWKKISKKINDMKRKKDWS